MVRKGCDKLLLFLGEGLKEGEVGMQGGGLRLQRNVGRFGGKIT
jgi:hypothetical protein